MNRHPHFDALVRSYWVKRVQYYRDSAVKWRTPDENGRYLNGWSKEDCEREADFCEQEAAACERRAPQMPVKVVLTYEDGTEDIIT